MGKERKEARPLPTIWRVPDKLWECIVPMIEALDPPARTGRPRAEARPILDGVIFRLRTGCQWNRLPERFGDDSTIHRTFQRWLQRGVLDAVWAELVEQCEELGGLQWRWQAADTAMGKAFGGAKQSAQTPRIARKRA